MNVTSKHQGNVIDYNFTPHKKNYGLLYVVWYYEVIVIEYKTVLYILTVFIFAIIICISKSILT